MNRDVVKACETRNRQSLITQPMAPEPIALAQVTPAPGDK
jgi:hypothetical protein